MFILVSILAVLSCIALVLLVIIQNSKGGGLAGNIQSVAAASQFFGSRGATELVEKLTWGFASAVVILAIMSNFFRTEVVSTDDTTTLRSKRAMETAAPAPAGATAVPDVSKK